MKKIIATVAALLCLNALQAQNVNDNPKDNKSSGSVSVKQSEDISNLVNGTGKQKEQESTKAEEKPRQESNTSKESTKTESRSSSSSSERRETYNRERERSNSNISSREDEKKDKERRERERKAREAARAQKIREAEENAGAISTTSKKLMSNSKRVTGYRVQVYAGGNTRESRAEAQKMGAKLKTEVAGQPIYVHFYSPRWCCRCGNFRNQDEAKKMAKKLSKLGYKNACVVKTIITVNK